MPSSLRRTIGLTCGLCLLVLARPESATPDSGPRFSITIPPGRAEPPIDGRLLLLLSTDPAAEPRMQINDSPRTQMVFGMDVEAMTPARPVTLDASASGFPVRGLNDVPAGDYFVQAVLHRYETFRRADGHILKLPMDRGEGQHWNLAPGNLYSTPRKVSLGTTGDPVAIELDKEIPPIPEPKDTKYIRHLKIQSALLTKFWGRPMFLSANVLVPEGFDTHTDVRYPLMISEDHFNTDFVGFRTDPPDPNLAPDYSDRFHLSGYNRIQQEEAYKFYQQWSGPNFPRILVAEINHANPYYDDSYAVNSANLGPYGDAIETELIPAIEKQFRGIGQGWARFVYGGSTGGWEAMAVQMFYPDHYNGAFIACPDPVDFRAYTTVNIYEDANAFYLQGTHTRYLQPAARNYLGQTLGTVQSENQYELALGSHARSGEQFDIWQAVFGPVGDDGYPKPIFDKQTGVIDRSVAAYWKEHYDLSAILQRDWATLGPKLKGKLRVYVGSADTYFLNNAVYYLEDVLQGDEGSVLRRRSEVRRARGALLERRSEPAERALAAALPHDVSADHPGSHREDRAGGCGSEGVEGT